MEYIRASLGDNYTSPNTERIEPPGGFTSRLFLEGKRVPQLILGGVAVGMVVLTALDFLVVRASSLSI